MVWQGILLFGLNERVLAAMNAVVIDTRDNVAVATVGIKAQEPVAGTPVVALNDVPQWHKVAISAIPAGGRVVKYGEPIGVASADIQPGEHVHTHNLKAEGE